MRRMCIGYTQKELAKALGVTQAALASWERGDAVPSRQRLPDLCRCLEVDIDELLEILGDTLNV